MPLHPIHLKRVGRVAAVAVLGAALITTVAHIDEARHAAAPVMPLHALNPLTAELERCRNIVRPEDVDARCRAAWAEAQRRFFDTHEAKP